MLLKKCPILGCAIGLSMLAGETRATVNVVINGNTSCTTCAQLENGQWNVDVDMSEYANFSTVEVSGTAGDVIRYISIQNDTPNSFKVLTVGGSLSNVINIEPRIFVESPGELFIATVTAGQIGTITAHSIGDVLATSGDVLTVNQLATGYAGGEDINSVITANGSITGAVVASGSIGMIRADSGVIGSSQYPLNSVISSGKSIGSIKAEAVHAAISITGSAADIDSLVTTVGDFSGSLTCRKIVGTTALGAYGLRVAGDLVADIHHTAVMNTGFRIGGSFASGASINLPSQGHTKQTIFAAGGSGSWSSTAHVNLGGIALSGEPYYTNPANTVGNGSAGLATFDIHHESCTPAEGASALGYGPHYTCQGEEDCCARFKKAYVRMYGPITQTQSPAVTVKYRPAGSSSSFTAVSWGVVTAVSSTDPRTLEVSRAYNAAWEPGDNYEYLIEPNGSLKSAEVDGTPSVVPFQYKFTLTSDCGSEQGFTGGGFDMNNDGRMTSADLVAWVASPRDLTADGNVNSADLARLARIVARFSN